MTEQEARDLIAKALEAEGWPNTALSLRNGGEAYMRIAIRALLPLLATSELERRALEACEGYAKWSDASWSAAALVPQADAVRAVGRESLTAKKPKGPWRVENHAGASRVLRDDPTGKWIDCEFYGRGNVDRAEAECSRLNSEWVRGQNEREAGR